MAEEIPTTGYDVPDDANESDPPDADQIELRADEPDPAFDEVDGSIEDPIADEDEEPEPDLGPEDPALLEADEQTDPGESDLALPPEEE